MITVKARRDPNGRQNPLISVVIPTYNSEKTIGKCLTAVFSSSFSRFEVIVVDDCSTDSTSEIVSRFDCRLINLQRNSGPATARNKGVEKAKGGIIFFVDSDVILKKDALERTWRFYKENPDAVCVIGMYAKQPANRRWFNYYMAYWKYYTWTNPLPKFFTFFIASCGSIKKDIFLELGGFNTRYKGADVEDYDFGYRLARRQKIYFNPYIQGFHYFPTFKSCVKNYFKRSSQWFSMFVKRKKFDTGGASAATGISFVLAALSLLALFFMILNRGIYTLLLFLAFAGMYMGINLKFFYMTLSEKGIIFMFYSVLINYVLALTVSAGIAISVFRSAGR